MNDAAVNPLNFADLYLCWRMVYVVLPAFDHTSVFDVGHQSSVMSLIWPTQAPRMTPGP